MNNPYRTTISKEKIKTLVYKRNIIAKVVRYLFFSLVLFFLGKYKQRYPIKCPCGIRSWDPNANRKAGGYIRRSELLNNYRCGKRHDLRGVVYYG